MNKSVLACIAAGLVASGATAADPEFSNLLASMEARAPDGIGAEFDLRTIRCSDATYQAVRATVLTSHCTGTPEILSLINSLLEYGSAETLEGWTVSARSKGGETSSREVVNPDLDRRLDLLEAAAGNSGADPLEQHRRRHLYWNETLTMALYDQKACVVRYDSLGRERPLFELDFTTGPWQDILVLTPPANQTITYNTESSHPWIRATNNQGSPLEGTMVYEMIAGRNFAPALITSHVKGATTFEILYGYSDMSTRPSLVVNANFSGGEWTLKIAAISEWLTGAAVTVESVRLPPRYVLAQMEEGQLIASIQEPAGMANVPASDKKPMYLADILTTLGTESPSGDWDGDGRVTATDVDEMLNLVP